jgi:hypothetical protein
MAKRSKPPRKQQRRDYISDVLMFGSPTPDGDVDVDPVTARWLDAIYDADNGDKSALVALLKSGKMPPDGILPHVGDFIERTRCASRRTA